MKEQYVSSVSVAGVRQVRRVFDSGRQCALWVDVLGFVYKETSFCGLLNVTQTKVGNHLESVIPGDKNGPNGGQITPKPLPVQRYRGHTTLRGEVSCVFRFYEVFGIEEVLRRRGNGISSQRSDDIKKTYGCESSRLEHGG